METLDEVVQAPAEMGNALIGVQEGTDMDLNIRLESVVDGILVSGTTVVDVHGECSLCLDPIDYEMSTNIQELFVFEKAPSGGPEDEDDEQYAVEGESIDLEPALRDAVILQLPFQPVCRETCQGLCSECGARLEEDKRNELWVGGCSSCKNGINKTSVRRFANTRGSPPPRGERLGFAR